MAERPLWAPWRSEYVAGSKDGECIFCTLPAQGDDVSARIVDRGTYCYTMLNAFPYASGHVMVSPYRHLGDFAELAEDELLELMLLSRRAVCALRQVLSPAGFNLGLNVGRPAGAGFGDHLHLHVVPRWEGDTNFMPVVAGTRVISQALEATREALVRSIRALPLQ
jgi:ATP adenylyltransferase